MAHIVVWEIHYGKVPAGFLIDHIDRNKSNNRIGNLRLVTHSQNQQNRGKDSRKASGLPKGVSRHSKGGYQARIKLDGISYEKYHKSLEEAVKWRSLKEIELHTHRPL